MNPRKVNECNDIAAFEFPTPPFALPVEEGSAVLELELELVTEVVSLDAGTIVYRCPANEVVVPVGARVMNGPGELTMVSVAPSVVRTVVTTAVGRAEDSPSSVEVGSEVPEVVVPEEDPEADDDSPSPVGSAEEVPLVVEVGSVEAVPLVVEVGSAEEDDSPSPVGSAEAVPLVVDVCSAEVVPLVVEVGSAEVVPLVVDVGTAEDESPLSVDVGSAEEEDEDDWPSPAPEPVPVGVGGTIVQVFPAKTVVTPTSARVITSPPWMEMTVGSALAWKSAGLTAPFASGAAVSTIPARR